MREIKFRMVTQTTGKILGYVDIYDLLRNGSDVLPDFEEAILEGVKFEQYTGLKDKNGKEIYEGDIIKFADLELAMNPTGVVCFADGRFFVKDWEFDDGSYHIVDFYDYNIPHQDFEVIGNIHENPELLGGKK